ncbi:hypothetical protein CEXT_814371 [Caerostris extrusa]|uniref:Uncharacterized protein n=1 Tax=Caerostris extrusa TaxID=172846 RepID=A0AAV4QZ89_CAEEX|nr:hypothetical protein CEXT_814371 [Caerostris extrusa]
MATLTSPPEPVARVMDAAINHTHSQKPRGRGQGSEYRLNLLVKENFIKLTVMLQIRKLLFIPVFALIFHAISSTVEAGSESCDVDIPKSCPPRPPSSHGINNNSRNPFNRPYSLDSLSTFVSIFKEAVYSSQSLSCLFDFDNTPATEFSEKIYQVILEALQTLGADDQIYAATKGPYVREMERAAMCYQSQYEALSAGFVNFLTSSGLFTVDSVLMVCLEYGNEWKLAAQACQ